MSLYRIYFRRRGGKWGDPPPSVVVKGTAERDRILARKTPIAVSWERARKHSCSKCARSGPWARGWTWRGAFHDLDEGKPILIACSEACRPDEQRRSFWSSFEPLSQAERTKRFQLGLTESDRQRLTRERRTVPLPKDWKGAGWCRWCGGYIEGRYRKNRNWHPDCKQTWLLHYDRDAQTRFLIERDGYDCWDCKQGGRWWRLDLVVPKYAWQGVPGCMARPRTNADWDRLFPLAGTRVDGVIVGLYSSIQWRPHCGGLEVDHDTPLWSIWHLSDEERRPFYGPDNLRLRCQTCHKAKSKREAAERALARKS